MVQIDERRCEQVLLKISYSSLRRTELTAISFLWTQTKDAPIGLMHSCNFILWFELGRFVRLSSNSCWNNNSFENTAFIRLYVGLSDVGIVIKNRFLNFISKLQAHHYSSDLLDLCFCELWLAKWLWLVQLFYFSLSITCLFGSFLDGNSQYLVFFSIFSVSIRFLCAALAK